MPRASFDGVLGTNYVPTQDERRWLGKLVESKEQELSFLNDIIAPLLAKRVKLNDDILAYKALLAPARRLLPELLKEVFTHSVNYYPPGQNRLVKKDAHLYRFAKPAVNEAPLVLGRICRHWRRIALSTSTLWSTIDIPRHFNIGGLREWISRAGSCNLSFGLFIEGRDIDVLNFLASHQERWSEVVLGMGNYDDMKRGREFLAPLSPGFRSLQTLEIFTWRSSESEIPLAIGSAPNLRRLMVHNPSFIVTTLNNSPPLCLHEIDVGSRWWVSTTDLLTLLRLSTMVEVVRANVQIKLERGKPHRDILTLPAVKHMEIILLNYGDQKFCVLERLHAPALEYLSFRTTTRKAPPQIRSFIHRSHPPLKVLRVWGSDYLPSVDIMECLPFLPLLSILHLEDLKGQIDGLINALTGPIPPSSDNLTGCLCPELKEIYLASTYIPPPDSESVINMILSRSHFGKSRLAHVTVLSCPESEVLEDPRIIDCVANGLTFVGCKVNG
ncbi:hypothetical protein BD410DRAFT_380262 [Rickenella mellea]|uniref:F-box domain-containing protein n=1 Tax=Rickenella mellea TaxID=50990 RepID=A0A4Y7Q0M7_9AGAM|nr:hypothetical protein BD410DRAFT_380262 [Rickenella mellea]